ncbi:MAG: hypothetical protein II237_02375 [Clostridia bacterium]|nr:hypothetical protein [Clostridia bacterium]
MDAIKVALENMFAAKTWESLIAVIEAIMTTIFGVVAKDEDLNYTPVA